MKDKIIRSIIFCLVWFNSAMAQTEVRLEGVLGDTIKSISMRIVKDWAPNLKVIPTVYVIVNRESTECYFGIILYPEELKEKPPSSFYKLPDGRPLLIYNGSERIFVPIEPSTESLMQLASEYLEPETLPNAHYNFWYCSFMNGKVIQSVEVRSKKQAKSIPKWIPRK